MKKTYVLFIVIFVLQLHTKVFAQDKEQIMKLYNQATVALEMGYTNDAISKLKEIIQMAPNFPESYLMLGNAYAKEQSNVKSIEFAISAFQKYLVLKPDAQNASEVKASVDKLEFLLGKLEKKEAFRKNLQGRWLTSNLGTDLDSNFPQYSLILDIYEIGGKIQIIMHTSSLWYSPNLVSFVAYPEIDEEGNWLFYFTSDKTYIPSQATYNRNQDLINNFEQGMLSGTSNPIARALISGGATGARYSNELKREQDVQRNNKAHYEFSLKPNPDNMNEISGVMRVSSSETTPYQQKVVSEQFGQCKLIKVRNDYVNRNPQTFYSDLEPEVCKMFTEGANLNKRGQSRADNWQYGTIFGASFTAVGGLLWTVFAQILEEQKKPDYVRSSGDVGEGDLTAAKIITFVSAGLLTTSVSMQIKGNNERKKGRELIKKANEMHQEYIKNNNNRPTSQLNFGVSGNGLALTLTF